MNSKRGLLGTIIIAVVLAVLMIGAFLYFQVRTNGIQFKTGNFVFNIKYEKDAPLFNQTVSIIETPKDNEIQNGTENDLALNLNNFTLEAEHLADNSTF
jgi:hypothetical protein